MTAKQYYVVDSQPPPSVVIVFELPDSDRQPALSKGGSGLLGRPTALSLEYL